MKYIVSLSIILLIAAGCQKTPANNTKDQAQNEPANTNTHTESKTATENIPEKSTNALSFAWPISNPTQRVTKKPFGIKVSPQNSPVTPEKFSGYHNAVDFEIISGEEDVDVEITAVCEGKLLTKRTATGYGGVIVQSCTLDENPVTVVYGHIKLSSVDKKVGDAITIGERLGVLGKGYSSETDGERKHLHLGIHKGSAVNIAGYVQTEAALKDWIDIRTVLN
jgi:hypothetical protein